LHKDIQHHQAGNHLQRHSNIIRTAATCKDIQTLSGQQRLAKTFKHCQASNHLQRHSKIIRLATICWTGETQCPFPFARRQTI
jgi:hypothetical protein